MRARDNRFGRGPRNRLARRACSCDHVKSANGKSAVVDAGARTLKAREDFRKPRLHEGVGRPAKGEHNRLAAEQKNFREARP